LAKNKTQISNITHRLRRVRISTMTVGILSAVLLSLVVLGSSWVLISALDMGLGFDGAALRTVAVFLLVAALGTLAYGLVRVFSISHAVKAYAARVGVELKEVGLDILTVLDLSEADTARLGYSQVLITKVIDDVTAKLKHFDFEVSVKKRAVIVYSVPLACLVLAAFVWMHYDTPSLSYSFARFRFFLGLSDQSGISVSVHPGDDEILAGSDLEIVAEVSGFVRQAPTLHVMSDGEETAFALERRDSVRVRGQARFANTLARVDRDVSYFVTLGDEVTRAYRISVYEKPRIKSGMITLAYPAYMGRKREILPQGIWDINAPYGTEVSMELEANCAPESVWVAMEDSAGVGERLPVTVKGNALSFQRILYKDLSYSINLVTGDGTRATPHGPHTVKVTRDEPPYVRIESPDEEVMLEADMMIPLSVVALDDYGISAMKLVYECLEDTTVVDLPYRGKTQAKSDYDWDVGRLDLFPGDVVTYYVSVVDNDALTGPKYARTDAYVARVPTMHELYQEIEDQQYDELESLEEIAKEARELKDEFSDLIEDMKRKSDLDWEEQQAVRQNLEDQAALKERIEDVASSLDETLDLMGQNSLVDFAVIEKMEEIRQLLSEVATDEMLEMMDKMREAMEQLSPEEMRAAMENLNLTQEELLRRLDRTLELLKQLQAQQRMEAVVNLAKEIAEGQKEVNDELREGGDPEQAAEKEGSLIRDRELLEDMMNSLADLLRQQNNPIASDIDKAGEFMEASGIPEEMSMAMSSMSEGKPSQALNQGESAEKGLSQLAAMLQSAMDQLMNEDKKQIMEAMTDAMHGLMEVSRRHEEVLHQLGLETGEIPAAELARMEMVYKEALDRIAERLFDVSKKSLFVSPTLGQAVLDIGNKLQGVSDLLSQGKKGRARGDVQSALGSMNQLVTGLMDAMDQASSCSSPGGLCDAFQNLENMCGMQMGINQGTQQIFSMGEEGLSMQVRSEMARLAAEQDAVRKGIEELANEFGGRNEILGRLDDLADEARRVINDLRQRNVNRETVERQERILTRLLNAQKSMRRRDYSQRRKSKPGETYEMPSPPQLSLEEREEILRDLLSRKRGYYPPEYEELIRAYFKVISSKKAGQ
jgi:hypothetical protein